MNTGIPIDSMTSNIVILEGLCWFFASKHWREL